MMSSEPLLRDLRDYEEKANEVNKCLEKVQFIQDQANAIEACADAAVQAQKEALPHGRPLMNKAQSKTTTTVATEEPVLNLIPPVRSNNKSEGEGEVCPFAKARTLPILKDIGVGTERRINKKQTRKRSARKAKASKKRAKAGHFSIARARAREEGALVPSGKKLTCIPDALASLLHSIDGVTKVNEVRKALATDDGSYPSYEQAEEFLKSREHVPTVRVSGHLDPGGGGGGVERNRGRHVDRERLPHGSES